MNFLTAAQKSAADFDAGKMQLTIPTVLNNTGLLTGDREDRSLGKITVYFLVFIFRPWAPVFLHHD